MIKTERIYCQINLNSGMHDWFFSAREGKIGPFSSQTTAHKALEEFVKFNSDNAWGGDRNSSNICKPESKPNERFLSQIIPENKLER